MTLDTQTKANQSQIVIKMHTAVKNSFGYSLLKVLTVDFLITIKFFLRENLPQEKTIQDAYLVLSDTMVQSS